MLTGGTKGSEDSEGFNVMNEIVLGLRGVVLGENGFLSFGW